MLTKRYLFIFLGLLLLVGLAACDDEMNENLAYDDECLNDPDCDLVYEDDFCDEYDEDCEEAGFWDDTYYETAEDCYEDEVYDPVDQLCYVEWEDEEDCPDDECGEVWGVLGDLLGSSFADADFDEFGENAIITYDVRNNELTNPQLGEVTADLESFQADEAKHREIWARFTQLIPAAQRAQIVQFSIFTDGPEEVMAAVNPVAEGDLSRWALAVDIQDAADDKELTYSLIHEFAHVLTLNNRQVDTAVSPSACTDYFPGEGCALSTSYIDAFHDRFWVQVFDEMGVNDETELDESDMEDFYYDHEDWFVTDYAATNPGEDIAESFTAFILQPKPTEDTLAAEKILFFYDYPELVALRKDLASRAYSRLRRN
ncbi:MAG: hypothetical protein H6660_14235 [Ardenticatenaceae bacterium]|nr:hypothetical protein [Ardenticatenaceae bacterium]